MNTSLHHIDCVLLDRDGVINFDSEDYIKHPDEWQPIPGALEAIAKLQQHVPVAVCTNQSGLGRGLFKLEALEAIHRKMYVRLTEVGGQALNIHFCPHTPNDQCPCRKPKGGLLMDALQVLDKEPQRSVFVGDSKRDIEAALTIGSIPVLVRSGNGATTAQTLPPQTAAVFDDLPTFVDVLIESRDTR